MRKTLERKQQEEMATYPGKTRQLSCQRRFPYKSLNVKNATCDLPFIESRTCGPLMRVAGLQVRQTSDFATWRPCDLATWGR